MRHGKYGYYLKCSACDGNTPYDKTCPNCRKRARLRKDKRHFLPRVRGLRVFEAVSRESHSRVRSFGTGLACGEREGDPCRSGALGTGLPPAAFGRPVASAECRVLLGPKPPGTKVSCD